MKNICLNGLNEQTAPTELEYFLSYSFYKQKAPTELIKYENTAIIQNSIRFLKNEMLVEKMIITKAKPHRGELFVEMKQPMKLSSVGATCVQINI